jgi:anti-sigma regulatory factor (Ser/Thr protein kinase)
VPIRPGEILRLRLRCDASAPRLARRAIERLEALAPVKDEALLVTSELTTNAVMHSGADATEEIEVKAELVSDMVRIVVKDRHRSRSEPALRDGEANIPGAIGLRVIETLGRRWGAEHGEGLSVWVELPL